MGKLEKSKLLFFMVEIWFWIEEILAMENSANVCIMNLNKSHLSA